MKSVHTLKGASTPVKSRMVIVPSCGVTYAVTISPNPRFIHASDPHEQMQIILRKVFKHFKSIGEIYLALELNSSGNVHCHGFLTVHDKIAYGRRLKNFVEHHVGFIHLLTLDGTTRWHEYCTKDLDYMFELFDEPLLYETNKESLHYMYITSRSFSMFEKDYKRRNNIKVDVIDYFTDDIYASPSSGQAEAQPHEKLGSAGPAAPKPEDEGVSPSCKRLNKKNI